MKQVLRTVSYLVIGLLIGYLFGFLTIERNPIVMTSYDTSIVDTTIFTWEYKPTIIQEVTGEVAPSSDETEVQDNIHQIPFTVEEGTGNIVYDVETRHGELSWTPAPVRLPHTFTYETVTITNEIPLQPEVRFHKPSFAIGCGSGVLGTVGLILLTVKVLSV